MIEVSGATFAQTSEIERGMRVRRLAGFQVVVDVQRIEQQFLRLWLDDGSTITLGVTGFVEVAR